MAAGPNFEYCIGLTDHIQQDKIGNENGGTPALQLPDDKGRRRGGENPAGGARGGGGVRGGRDFSSKKPGGIDDIQLLQTAFNLAATLICSVKQTLAADSL